MVLFFVQASAPRPVKQRQCYLVCGMVHIIYFLPLIEKCSPCSGGSGFPLSHYLSGPLPHVRRHITVYKYIELVLGKNT